MAKCLCGCQEDVPEGKRFRPAHHLRKSYRDSIQPKINKVEGRLVGIMTGEEMFKMMGGEPEVSAQNHIKYEPSDEEIETAAQLLCDYISRRDPTWADRIRIGREEKAWTARQFIFAMVGWMLDRSYHLEAPAHPALEPGVIRYGDKECQWPECKKTFKAMVPGQKFCSEECGGKQYRKERDEERARRKLEDDTRRRNNALHNRA